MLESRNDAGAEEAAVSTGFTGSHNDLPDSGEHKLKNSPIFLKCRSDLLLHDI